MKVSIIGNGGWGTALALVLNKNNHEVCVWGPDKHQIEKIIYERENIYFLPGVDLPESIIFTSDPSEAVLNSDIVVFVTPSRFYRSVVDNFKAYINENISIISATKGLDSHTYQTMSEVASEIIGRPISVLSGPSHAEEVARNIPCAVTISSYEKSTAEFFQKIFNNKSFRVYTSVDVKGVELGGAFKNVIAIAAGISDGLGFGDNTKAALMTRGLSEMIRLGNALNAQSKTFYGLSGVGDLMVTCMSNHSRNRGIGEKIGSGESLKNITSKTEMIVEGVDNARIIKNLAKKLNISLPICEQVNSVLYEGKDPKLAMIELMDRSPKSEH